MDKAVAVIAYLRSNPEALAAQGSGSLTLARERLRESSAAYRRGDQAEANASPCPPILTGSSPSKPCSPPATELSWRKSSRRWAIFATPLYAPNPEQLRARLASTEALLDQAEAALAPEAESGVATFLGAFAILLREGLEALLVVIAMIASCAAPNARTHCVRPRRLGCRLDCRRRDLGGRHLCDRDQRREPRADRGFRLAARGGHPAVRRNLDARQGAGRRMAAIHRDQDAGRIVARLCLVPVRPRLPRRLSRGVRDDPVLRGAVDIG